MIFFIKITYWIEAKTDGLSTESGGNSPKSIIFVSSSILFFNVWNVLIFLIYEKLLMESHPGIICIAGSKQHNGNSEANTCVGIYLWSSLLPILNRIASKNITLVRLLRGLNKNQFFHYFGLLHDLLRRQDLPNKSFDRRLKRSTMFLSIFVKDISPGWFYCPDSQGNFEMTLFVCLFFFSSFYCKFKIRSIRNCTFKKAWEEFCRNFISYIRKSFEVAVFNRF